MNDEIKVSVTKTSAAAYIRRSTNKQEKSLSDQRDEIERYASKQDYKIVRWYEDDAISGDSSPEHRPGFRALRDKACNGRDFDAILVWDQDRLGRWAPQEASYWTFPLFKAGVRLDTVTKGPVDWDDFAAWLKFSVDQHGKHQYLRDLSANTARGALSNATQGHSCGQRPPYGYDRMLIDESGKPIQRLRTGDTYVKPQTARVTWVPSEDPLKVKTVRWLFTEYTTKDIGFATLASQLNDQGVLSPSGGTWYASSVRAILVNPVYVGTFIWNRRRYGKYSRVAGNEIVPRDQGEYDLMPCGRATAAFNPPESWIVIENSHEPLIAKQLFDQVQEKVDRRKRSNRPGYATHTRHETNDAYLLTGLLYCAHCGRKMHGSAMTRKKKGKTYKYQRYICSSYTRGRECEHYSIRQDKILPLVIGKIRNDLLMGSEEKFKASLRRQLQQRAKPDTSQLQRLISRRDQLDKQIDQGADRLLTAPESLLDVLTPKLEQFKRERDLVISEIKELEARSKPIDIESQAERLAAGAWKFFDRLQDCEPAKARNLMQQAIERIELRFETRKQGRRRIHDLAGGKLVFREFTSSISCGDRI